MVNIYWLVLTFAVFKNGYCLTLPHNFNADEVNKTVKNVLTQSEKKLLNISIECVEQLGWFGENLQSFEDGMWALKMVDASAKVPSGVLANNYEWMGNFDQCLTIEATEKDVKAKYCLANLNGTATTFNLNGLQILSQKLRNNDSFEVQSPSLPSFGLCIPHKCDISDVRNILTNLLSSATFAITCQTKDELNKPLDTGAIITILYFGFFILLMALSTIYDLYHDHQKTKPHPLLIAFSIYTNGRRLFKISKNSEELSCLHGLRFLSMLWVILGHVLTVLTIGPLVNIGDFLNYLITKKGMFFVNGIYSVDTFMVITGFLVVYSFMKAVQKGSKFNIITFYLHRYLRLTPALIPVVLSGIFLIKYMGSGPFYPQTVYLSNTCKKYWWSTFLYIQNYVNPHDMCEAETWYLNVDWQLYLISPVFLVFLPKRPFIGLTIMLCGTIGAIVASFIVTWNNQIQALINNLYIPASSADYFQEKYYMKTHTRAANWFIGAFLGHFLAKIKFQSSLSFVQLPKWLVGMNWIIALTTIPVCIFAGVDTLNTPEYNAYGNAFYNAFARPAWGICIAWIIFACSLGYGGIINTILSLPIFQVLSRFTYSMYILHLTLLYIITLSLRQPAYYTLFNELYSFWGIFALSFGISIFWVLAFESPIPIIEKYLLGNKGGRSENRQEPRNDVRIQAV